MQRFLVLATFALLAAMTPSLRAALPPDCYPDPKKATEDVDLKIRYVNRRVTSLDLDRVRWDVTVVADVVAVRKTASALRPGSRVTIRYNAFRNWNSRIFGVSSYPVPEKGVAVSAVLNYIDTETGRVFNPGGAPYSTFGTPATK